MSANKRLLGIGLIFIFACVFLLLAGAFFPRAVGFLDGVMCPDGMQLSNHAGEFTDEEGNSGTAINVVCVGEGQANVDATPRMLFLLFGLAIVGGAFVVWSFGGIKRVN